MSEQNRTTLKTFFDVGAIPNEEEFADLIDSVINKIDDGITVDTSKNVGLGITVPTEKLSVEGNISVSGTVDGRDLATDGVKLDELYTTNGLANLKLDQVEELIRIGSSEFAQLEWSHLSEVDQALKTSASVAFKDLTTGEVKALDDQGLKLSDQSGAGLFVADGGNIGLGITVPTEKLSVEGNISVSGSVDGRDLAVDGAKLDELYTTNGLANLKLDQVEELIRIGSSEFAQLEWSYLSEVDQPLKTTASVAFKDLTTGEVKALDDQGLKLSDQSGAGLFVADGGNIGLGIAVPTEKLSVEGNISVSGTVDGRDLAADGVKLDELYTTNGLANLKLDQVEELIRIGSSEFAQLEWSHLSEVDQPLKTTASVAFKDLTTKEVKALDDQGLKLSDQSGAGLFVADGGNIGLGIAVPTEKLSVEGNISVSGTVDSRDLAMDGAKLDNLAETIGLSSLTGEEVQQLQNIDTTVISATNWGYVGGLDQALDTEAAVQFGDVSAAEIKATDASGLRVSDQTGNGLFVEDGGQVGIGTSTPTEALEVNGTVKASAFVGDGSGLTGVPSGGGFWQQDASLNLSYTDGAVGIGTANPDAALHVRSGDSGTLNVDPFFDDFIVENNDHGGISLVVPDNNFAALNFASPSSDRGASIGWRYTSGWMTMATTKSGGQIVFQTDNGTEAMRILANGNVGIGTGSPDTPLHILGGSDANLSTGGYLILGDLSGKNLVFDSNEILARNNNNNSTLHFQGDGGDTIFHHNKAITEKVVIKANGDLGIGTENPTEKLHVIGNILATGTITPSDGRLKTKINPLADTLAKVSSLRGVTYYWNKEQQQQGLSEERQLGLIAQEVEAVLPEVVHTDRDGYKSVDYSRLVVVLIEAIKENHHLIQSFQSENQSLSQRIQTLENRGVQR